MGIKIHKCKNTCMFLYLIMCLCAARGNATFIFKYIF